MDIDDPPPPARDEIVGEQAHIAGQRDHLDTRLAESGIDRGFILGLGHALGGLRESVQGRRRVPRRGPGLLVLSEATMAISYGQAGSRAASAKRHHVGAAARDQNADLAPHYSPPACGEGDSGGPDCTDRRKHLPV